MVTPMFKKGKSIDASNYRPTSLTSFCCKLMESIIKDDILAHLLSKGLNKSPSAGLFIASINWHSTY